MKYRLIELKMLFRIPFTRIFVHWDSELNIFEFYKKVWDISFPENYAWEEL